MSAETMMCLRCTLPKVPLGGESTCECPDEPSGDEFDEDSFDDFEPRGITMENQRDSVSKNRKANIIEQLQAFVKMEVSGDGWAQLPAKLVNATIAYLAHLEEYAAAQRVVSLSEDDVSDMTVEAQSLSADPVPAMREQYHCVRCQREFAWQSGVNPFWCSAAESCPACRPLCPLCVAADDAAVHADCPGSGSPVKDGKHVTCMCSAVFENIKTVPRHRPADPKKNYIQQKAEALSGHPAEPEAAL